MVKIEAKIDESKGALLPKIEEAGHYVVTEVSVDQRVRRKDLPGRGKCQRKNYAGILIGW